MIDFNAPQWFDEYLRYRRQHPLQFQNTDVLVDSLNGGETERFQRPHPFYIALQQSGLVYGFPVHYPFQVENGLLEELSDSERAKLILLDVMMHARLLDSELPVGDAYAAVIDKNGSLMRRYYEALYEYGHGEETTLLEQILFKRVRFKKSYFDFRKTGVSSLLFWDLYFFLEYCETVETPDFEEITFFQNLLVRKKGLKIITLQILSAAAHADHRVSKQEHSLHHQFERSSRLLVEEEQDSLREIFQQDISLDRIEMPTLDWLARRFLLDICLLSIHADAQVDALEASFLEPLLRKLQLSSDDLLSSKADLGCFLVLHGEKLHIFKGKKTGILLLGEAVIENFMKLGHAAKMEAVETRDMATTFGKILGKKLRLNKNGELPNEQEIKEAISQLKDIPKFLPFFTMVFLPVPGITEAYIFLAFTLEKLSKGGISLLPSQISKVVKGEKKKTKNETEK